MLKGLRSISCLLLLIAAACSDDNAALPDSGALRDGTAADSAPLIDDAGNVICAEDEQRFTPGCDPASAFVTITEGCYQPCNEAGDARCDAEETCRQAWINPCVCDPTSGAACCEACGASQWLCVSKTLPYPLDNLRASCDGTFSAQDVLDSLLPNYAATFTYSTDATTALTLGVAYEGGQLVCHPQLDPPPGSDAPTKPAEIVMPLTITFVTADGAFEEGFEVTVRAQLAMVEFSKELPLGTINGNFTPPPSITRIAFQGSVGATTTNGHVRALEDGTGGGVVTVGGWDTPGR